MDVFELKGEVIIASAGPLICSQGPPVSFPSVYAKRDDSSKQSSCSALISVGGTASNNVAMMIKKYKKEIK